MNYKRILFLNLRMDNILSKELEDIKKKMGLQTARGSAGVGEGSPNQSHWLREDICNVSRHRGNSHKMQRVPANQ